MRHILFITTIISFLLCSCSNEEPYDGSQSGSPVPLRVNAKISGTIQTRVNRGTVDNWSYTDFDEGDSMGFFASGGNLSQGGTGSAPFDNQKLTYTGGTGGNNFIDDETGSNFSPTHMKGDEIFMYFPYSEDITSENGMSLRTYIGPENEELDTARCIDFLSARYLNIMSNESSDKAALYGTFQHSFAELIILRGEGFERPGNNDWSITAVLREPYTGIKVEMQADPWECEPVLVYDGTTPREKATSWEAWLGDPYFKTVNDTIGYTAWYVIVPTIGCQANIGATKPGERSTVEYIELYDNDGNLQRVTSLLLSNGNSKMVDAGWRYPMEITMKELVPTANPCTISPWNGDIDLTDARTRGITDEVDLSNWIASYNLYLTDKTNQTYSDALLKYGDRYITGEETSWHFYILNNINLTGYKQNEGIPSTGPLLNELQDILDGQEIIQSNGQKTNITITGMPATLIGNLKGPNAQVTNIDFSGAYIINNENSDAAAGIIVNSLSEQAKIENCNIYNSTLFNPGGPVGMVAGAMEEASIIGCELSGSLFGRTTAGGSGAKVVGSMTPNSTLNDNDASNVTFLPYTENEDEQIP